MVPPEAASLPLAWRQHRQSHLSARPPYEVVGHAKGEAGVAKVIGEPIRFIGLDCISRLKLVRKSPRQRTARGVEHRPAAEQGAGGEEREG